MTRTADRVVLVVLDSVGCGELPDASSYGDVGSDTLGNTARAVGGLKLPNLASLGLGNIHPVQGVPPASAPRACYGKMAEASKGKDTTTGHWEIAGLVLERAFPTFPQGFPPQVLEPFEKAIGRKALANKPASGTEILKEYGEEHLATGNPIVYTSADSVFQIAAHEEVVPVPLLYEWCRVARNLLTGEFAVGRVIARPFVGRPGDFRRTANRKDFSLEPPGPTLLDLLQQGGLQVTGVGKIGDIFAGRGLTRSVKTANNLEGVEAMVHLLREEERPGLIFANLVDFDTLYGHRNDPAGYARCLEEFDQALPRLLEALGRRDALVITADHGNDPTTPSTDHSREYVPLLIYAPWHPGGTFLGVRPTFADLAATVAQLLDVPYSLRGASFAEELACSPAT
ncbi:MAG TPA: phosphopentomutase [Candidatus Nitrosotenuis sp.]|jgi:phosphopentomutase|nr:phosphopentomutase [Candidatus Nitrosotenuis sp.]